MTRLSMIIKSHLNDAIIEIGRNDTLAKKRIAFVNKLVSKYTSLDEKIADEEVEQMWEGAFMKKGGKVMKKKRVRFADKVEAIADSLEGKKVPSKLEKDYGKRYNREEAEQAGKRIAGSQLKKYGIK